MPRQVRSHRLPQTAFPLHYDLHVVPDLTNFTFSAKETIKIRLKQKSVHSLTLHSIDLNITKAIWKANNSKVLIEINLKSIRYQKKSETVTFHFSKPISGAGELQLEFSGVILDGLQGFYRSQYFHNKEIKHLALTQLEATDARRMFVCFDEPSHKATFKLSLAIPKHLQAISNTIESSISPDEHNAGIKIVHFDKTPKMSTYLLALIIGELEHSRIKTRSRKSKSGREFKPVQIRIHTTAGKKAQTEFALKVTKQALEFLEDYFDIPYPMPVMDLVAVPDFSAGAMENWGAITFRETALLVDEAHTSFIAKQRVAEVIAHELVHQWFGNLVTMEWWTHLWLNESFATYMAYVVVDHLFPEWKFWTKFVLDEQSIALQKDALQTSLPVEVEVKSPSEISESFDPAIVYAKGASVLRMLASYVGEDNFRMGLSYYLKKHSYKNTESVHLWQAFEKVSHLPVRKFMHLWTKVNGYPVVDVTVARGQLIAQQHHLNLFGKNTGKQWIIPLDPVFGDQLGNNQSQILYKTKQSYPIPKDYQFIKLNEQEQNFFVTNYHPTLLARLLSLLKHKTKDPSLNNVDRLALVRNSFLLAKSGQIATDVFLEVVSNFKQDLSYIVWAELASDYRQINQIVYGTGVHKQFMSHAAEMFISLILNPKMGFKEKANESSNNKILRGLALMESGRYGYRPSIVAAKKYMTKPDSIPVDLRLAVYIIIATHAKSRQDLNQLLKRYRHSELASEKQQVLMAITEVSDLKLLPEVGKFIFSSEVRDQDRHWVLAYWLQHPSTRKFAWQQIEKNWKQLHAKYGPSKMLAQLVSGFSGISTEKEYNQYRKFIKTHDLRSAKLTLKQVSERIEAKLLWKSRDLAKIKSYLKKNQ